MNSPLVQRKTRSSAEPLNNLPLPTFEEYIGREKEKGEVYKLLGDKSKTRPIVIRGIGGMGKTALALEIAHSYVRGTAPSSDGEFEAVIWVSVGTSQVVPFSKTPLIREFRTLQDLLSAIATTFGIENAPDMTVGRLRVVVTDLLSKHNTLLIVDNLEESVSVEVLEFISKVPSKTRVLITTRFAIIDGEDLPLAGLEVQDAIDFASSENVKRSLHLSGEQIEQLVYSVSFVPMAILFALGQVQDGLSYEAVIAQLTTKEVSIAEVLLGKVLKRLEGTNTYSALLVVSLFSKDASEAAIGAAAKINDVAELHNVLERLVNLSLLQQQKSRFSMLPLVRRWLQGLLKNQPELEENLWGNLAQYYQKLAVASGLELEADVESAIDVAVWHMRHDKWETAQRILGPFASISIVEQYLDMARQMILTGQDTLDMYVAYATLEDMPRVCELESGEFEEGVASPPEKMMAIFYRDPKSFLVLKTKIGEIVGYASLWPVAPELIDDLLSRDRDYNQIKLSEVRPMNYGKKEPTDYWLDTIMVTDPKYNIVGAYMLLNALQKLLINPIRLVSVAVTPFGITLMRKLGMRIVWQTDEPVGEDINYCGIIDTRDPTQQTVGARLIRNR